MRISDWSSDVCSSDLELPGASLEPERIEKLHLQFPEFAARYVDLYNAHMRANERINMIEEAIANDHAVQARLPWEAARDWFHEAGNYVHPLDCLAGDMAASLPPRHAPEIERGA